MDRQNLETTGLPNRLLPLKSQTAKRDCLSVSLHMLQWRRCRPAWWGAADSWPRGPVLRKTASMITGRLMAGAIAFRTRELSKGGFRTLKARWPTFKPSCLTRFSLELLPGFLMSEGDGKSIIWIEAVASSVERTELFGIQGTPRWSDRPFHGRRTCRAIERRSGILTSWICRICFPEKPLWRDGAGGSSLFNQYFSKESIIGARQLPFTTGTNPT